MGFGPLSANTTESAAVAEQAIDRTKKNERTNIAASPQIRKVAPSGLFVPATIRELQGRNSESVFRQFSDPVGAIRGAIAPYELGGRRCIAVGTVIETAYFRMKRSFS